MKTASYLNTAFRSHTFVAYVAAQVWLNTPSRLARNYYRHGKRVSYSLLGTDEWQRGLWPMSEDEAAEMKVMAALPDTYDPNDLPF
ncbi:MAG: hypothetical protein ACRYFX_18630 [Janthinobacterium lividum]